MKLVYKSQPTYFVFSVIDEMGSFVSGLTISYEIRQSSTNNLIDSGTMVEETGIIYTATYQFSNSGEYYIKYINESGYESGIEDIKVIDPIARDETAQDIDVIVSRCLPDLQARNMQKIFYIGWNSLCLRLPDINGNLRSGLTIGFEIRDIQTGTIFANGLLSEEVEAGQYSVRINFTEAEQYRVVYLVPDISTQLYELITVVPAPINSLTGIATESGIEENIQLVLDETSKLESGMEDIQTEVNKIQPNIIDAKDDYKADVSGLALESTVEDVQEKVESIESGMEEDSDKIEKIKQVTCGRWKIIANQMIFYKEDNITEVMRFDLLDKDGIATMTDVIERRKA